jgi:hypothetical protein
VSKTKNELKFSRAFVSKLTTSLTVAIIGLLETDEVRFVLHVGTKEIQTQYGGIIFVTLLEMNVLFSYLGLVTKVLHTELILLVLLDTFNWFIVVETCFSFKPLLFTFECVFICKKAGNVQHFRLYFIRFYEVFKSSMKNLCQECWWSVSCA